MTAAGSPAVAVMSARQARRPGRRAAVAPPGRPREAPVRRLRINPADGRRWEVLHVHLPIAPAVLGAFWPDGARGHHLGPCGVPAWVCARASRAPGYDRGRTIFMPALAIIAIVPTTRRAAYKNDQFSRSERS